MTIVPLAIHALLTVALPDGGPLDWEPEARKSVALVTGLDGQPATGLIVGWLPPTLYIVTARHAVYEDGPDGSTITAKDVPLRLDPTVCRQPLTATPFSGDVDSDTAIVTATATDCEIGLSRLRSLHLTSLSAVNARAETTMVALVRAADNSIGPPLTFVLKEWGPLNLTLQPKTDPGWSGSPLFTRTGEIAGILRSGSSGDGFASDFVAVIKSPRFKGVPFNLAGLYSEVQLKGYPSGSLLTINGKPESVINLAASPQRLSLQPGRTRLALAAPGYDPVEDEVTVVERESITRCVRLVTPLDRFVAKTKWPLVGVTAALAVSTGIAANVTSNAKDDFYDMPTKAGLDDANFDVALTRGLLIGTGVAGALTLLAFAQNHFSLSPRLRSTVESCP